MTDGFLPDPKVLNSVLGFRANSEMAINPRERKIINRKLIHAWQGFEGRKQYLDLDKVH